MRVVAGIARGRRLQAPPGRQVRPTSDRVREAIFSMLASRDAVAGARVLDLFAGSGALGIEALSRGAASATFVDADPTALDAVRANLEATGLADAGATIVRADARRYVEAHPDDLVDIAFLDPPYAFADWPTLLPALRARLVVVESARAPELPADWAVLGQKRYGGTLVTLARPPLPVPDDAVPGKV